MNHSDPFDGQVVATIPIQLVGYAALSALVPHSDVATAVEPLRRVPAILLVPVAVLALCRRVAIGLGALLAVRNHATGPR